MSPFAPPNLPLPTPAAPAKATGWREVVAFFVPGKPVPGGSKKAFLHPHTKRIIVTDDAKNNAGWKQTVSVYASGAYADEPLDGTLRLDLTFTLTRPKGHYGTGRNAAALKPGAASYHTTKPDVLKLARAVEDALSGIIYVDDARIAVESMRKVYGVRPGVEIRVSVLDGGRQGAEGNGEG